MRCIRIAIATLLLVVPLAACSGIEDRDQVVGIWTADPIGRSAPGLSFEADGTFAATDVPLAAFAYYGADGNDGPTDSPLISFSGTWKLDAPDKVDILIPAGVVGTDGYLTYLFASGTGEELHLVAVFTSGDVDQRLVFTRDG